MLYIGILSGETSEIRNNAMVEAVYADPLSTGDSPPPSKSPSRPPSVTKQPSFSIPRLTPVGSGKRKSVTPPRPPSITIPNTDDDDDGDQVPHKKRRIKQIPETFEDIGTDGGAEEHVPTITIPAPTKALQALYNSVSVTPEGQQHKEKPDENDGLGTTSPIPLSPDSAAYAETQKLSEAYKDISAAAKRSEQKRAIAVPGPGLPRPDGGAAPSASSSSSSSSSSGDGKNNDRGPADSAARRLEELKRSMDRLGAGDANNPLDRVPVYLDRAARWLDLDQKTAELIDTSNPRSWFSPIANEELHDSIKEMDQMFEKHYLNKTDPEIITMIQKVWKDKIQECITSENLGFEIPQDNPEFTEAHIYRYYFITCPSQILLQKRIQKNLTLGMNALAPRMFFQDRMTGEVLTSAKNVDYFLKFITQYRAGSKIG